LGRFIPIGIENIKTQYPKGKISNHGNIKENYNTILKTYISHSGYKNIKLYINKKSITYLLHRLVAIVYINNFNNLKEVIYLNKNKINNSVYNLKWCSRKDTCKNTKNYNRGRVILQYDLNNNFIKRFISEQEASNIMAAKLGRKLMGYYWKYETEHNEKEFINLDNYPGYTISKNGDIYSKKNNILLKQKFDLGYGRVGLWYNNKQTFFLVHRLVAEQFIPNINNLLQVNHFATLDRRELKME
jgi:hypothetical protein